LIDTKTAARLDERWERQWQLSLQQRLYSYGVYKTFGRPPTYTLIEGLLKDKKNPKSKYVVTDWDDEELEEAIRTWEFYAERDRLLLQSTGCARAAFEEAAVRAPYNPMDCHAYYQDCPFLELCHDSPKLRSSGLRAYEIYDLLE
jgi:hypothetical protein